MIWKQITLVGVGLLGGSIGLAVKERRLARRVVGLVRREASLAECRQLGVVDEVTLNMAAALKGADLVILGTPILQMRPLAKQIAPLLSKRAVVTDVGSVKDKIVDDLEKIFASHAVAFIGSHPMAGGEKTGPGAARANLFESATCVVTPTPNSHPQAVERVEAFWASLGARTLRLPPPVHDLLVARTSHLPHVLACVLATYVLNPKAPPEHALLCATGFRDTTRVASGSPEMWRDIALENRKHLLQALEGLANDLQGFCELLKAGDPEAVLKFFQTAKQRRDAWLTVSPNPE